MLWIKKKICDVTRAFHFPYVNISILIFSIIKVLVKIFSSKKLLAMLFDNKRKSKAQSIVETVAMPFSHTFMLVDGAYYILTVSFAKG